MTTTHATRQTAKTLHFDAATSRHINWSKVGDEAEQLAASFEAIRHTDGAITVTIFWQEGATNGTESK